MVKHLLLIILLPSTMMGGERLLSSYCVTRDKANLFANGAH